MFWRSKGFIGDRDRGALARSLYRSMGYTDSDFKKPFIAIVNTWNDICPGQFMLRNIAAAVREGIREAGGTAVEFGTIGPCDGIAQSHAGMHYILPSRELIANSIELMVQAHMLDGMVLLGSCDKVVPGLLMAAARINLPAILVNAGPMYPGTHNGRHIDVNATQIYLGKCKGGSISAEEFRQVECSACPTPGSCTMIGTANTIVLSGGSNGHVFDRLRHDTGRRQRPACNCQAVGPASNGIGHGKYQGARYNHPCRFAQCRPRGNGHRRLDEFDYAHAGNCPRSPGSV